MKKINTMIGTTRVGTGIPAPTPINKAEINKDNTGSVIFYF